MVKHSDTENQTHSKQTLVSYMKVQLIKIKSNCIFMGQRLKFDFKGLYNLYNTKHPLTPQIRCGKTSPKIPLTGEKMDKTYLIKFLQFWTRND